MSIPMEIMMYVTPEVLIVAAFTVYRLTLMINKEAGPGDMFGKLRTRLGVKYDAYSNPVSTGVLSEIVLCPYCLSVWVGFGVTAWLIVAKTLGFETLAFYVLLPFALSGISSFMFKWAGV